MAKADIVKASPAAFDYDRLRLLRRRLQFGEDQTIITVRRFIGGEPYPFRIIYPNADVPPVGHWAVYALIDPRGWLPFYVGKTEQFRTRMMAHCKIHMPACRMRNGCLSGHDRLVLRKFEIGESGLPAPCLVISHTPDHGESARLEAMLIPSLGRPMLLNSQTDIRA